MNLPWLLLILFDQFLVFGPLPLISDTVSSQIMHYFVLSECNIRSGLSDVTAMCLGNFSWISKSTVNCQSSAEDNRFVFSLLFLCIFSPAFTKLICFNFPGWCLLALIALVTSFAITLSTWSWRQRYRPSPKAFGQLLRICCKDPFLAHSWQLGVSIFPHMCRFVGLGNTSYTDLMRNRISLKSGRQQSDHVTLFFSTSSHLV